MPEEPKNRIPVVTMASLVLGMAACDDGGDGTDTSKARQERLAKRFCSTYLRCFEDVSYTQAECEEYYTEYFADAGEDPEVSEECFDAVLDYFECYASLSCETLQEEGALPCDEQGDAADKACTAEEATAGPGGANSSSLKRLKRR